MIIGKGNARVGENVKKSHELLFRVKKTLRYNVYVLTLHLEIRDGHHFTSDYPYFLRARKHSEIRDGHRFTSDYPYFLRARKHPEIRDGHRSASDKPYFIFVVRHIIRATHHSKLVV